MTAVSLPATSSNTSLAAGRTSRGPVLFDGMMLGHKRQPLGGYNLSAVRRISRGKHISCATFYGATSPFEKETAIGLSIDTCGRGEP